MNIKSLKPNRLARTRQGYINPKSCKKLFPGLNNELIIFRSNWERKYAYWCETNKNVKYWGSECLTIPYAYIDNSTHTYNPDFVVEMTDGSIFVIEIKPKNQCIRPLNENGWLWEEYKKNMCKWTAAKKFCDDRGLKFKILTEETISKMI